MKLATCAWGTARYRTYISCDSFMMPKNLRTIGKILMRWARRSTSLMIHYPTAFHGHNYFTCRIHNNDLPFDQIYFEYVDFDFDLAHKTINIRVNIAEY